MTVDKLKPCPWCGGALQEARVVEGDTFRWRKLQGCCTDGPEVHIDTLADDRVGAEERAAQAAIDAWNTRAPQWQPIESAPKTTRSILVWCPERQNQYMVFWDSRYEGEWRTVGGGTSLTEQPTHWQPLPVPPEVGG